jgi:hypothetical protein
VPPGRATFRVSTAAVPADTCAIITATASGGAQGRAVLKVLGPGR